MEGKDVHRKTPTTIAEQKINVDTAGVSQSKSMNHCVKKENIIVRKIPIIHLAYDWQWVRFSNSSEPTENSNLNARTLKYNKPNI